MTGCIHGHYDTLNGYRHSVDGCEMVSLNYAPLCNKTIMILLMIQVPDNVILE